MSMSVRLRLGAPGSRAEYTTDGESEESPISIADDATMKTAEKSESCLA